MAADDMRCVVKHLEEAIYHSNFLSPIDRCDFIDYLIAVNKKVLEQQELMNSINTIIDWVET